MTHCMSSLADTISMGISHHHCYYDYWYHDDWSYKCRCCWCASTSSITPLSPQLVQPPTLKEIHLYDYENLDTMPHSTVYRTSSVADVDITTSSLQHHHILPQVHQSLINIRSPLESHLWKLGVMWGNSLWTTLSLITPVLQLHFILPGLLSLSLCPSNTTTATVTCKPFSDPVRSLRWHDHHERQFNATFIPGVLFNDSNKFLSELRSESSPPHAPIQHCL